MNETPTVQSATHHIEWSDQGKARIRDFERKALDSDPDVVTCSVGEVYMDEDQTVWLLDHDHNHIIVGHVVENPKPSKLAATK